MAEHARHTPASCAHNPYLNTPNPACEGCLKTPLSGPAYPDHVGRKMYAELADKAKAVLDESHVS